MAANVPDTIQAWPKKRRALLRASNLSNILIPIFLFTTGCNFPGQPDPADRPVPADQVTAFATLYSQNCAGCHGAGGKLGPAPPHNDTLFRAIVPKAELEDILTRGRNKTLMPAFATENGGTLTAAQIQVLVHEIKGIPYKVVAKHEGATADFEIVADVGGIAPTWGIPGKQPASVPSYLGPSPSLKGAAAGDKQKGAVVFARACAVCHGDQGKGIPQGGALIHTINDPVFLALNSDQVLRRYAITGRPDLGMPNYAEARPDSTYFQALTNQEVDDLVALLAYWRGKK
jgi:mono/diheme cytochrome c family protein